VVRRAHLPLEALKPYLLDIPNPSRLPPAVVASLAATPLVWTDLFGNERPVEIEVGFGKGLFLLNESQARPQTNFLGVEVERKYTFFTAARLAQLGVGNVKVACTEASWFLQNIVAAASVEAIHVYFPDPWWKTRHRKRRLFTGEFAEACVRDLRLGGSLSFVSDVREYFDETLEMLANLGRLKLVPTLARGEADYLTNFERKYRKEGRPIFRARFART
jgi:tRNA (guanine-N7-)-methyltransferase